MNKKGFAATGILYTILVLFILLFSGMLTILYSRNNILIQIQNQIRGNIYKDVTLNIKGTEYTQSIATEVDFDISGIDISDVTHIACNNGAEAIVENNHVIISKALGGTICHMNTALNTTISELDNTRNYILMLQGEEFKKMIVVDQNKNLVLDLNGKELTFNVTETNNYAFRILGNLNIIDEVGTGKITGKGNSLKVVGNSVLNVNGGTYNLIDAYVNATLNIKNSNHQCSYREGDEVKNCAPIYLRDDTNSTFDSIKVSNSPGTAIGMAGNSNATINNNSFLSCEGTNCVFFNSTGKLTLDKVTIESVGTAIRNQNSGTVEIINGSKIDSSNLSLVLTNNGHINVYNSTIHSIDNGSIFIDTTSTADSSIIISDSSVTADKYHAIGSNGAANINIFNSNLIGSHTAIAHAGTGNININGGTYQVNGEGQQGAISNRSTGIINICSGTIKGLESKYDLYNVSSGTIKYKSNVVLTNNKIYNNTSYPTNILVDNNITCK